MGPRKRASQRPSANALGAVLRWGFAVSIAAVVTLALVGSVVVMVDGQWILDTLIRVLPLSTEPVGEHDLPARDPTREYESVSVEGTVGTFAGDRFVPLQDAEILGIRPGGDARPIELGPGGSFRLEAEFPDDRLSAPSDTQLLIRSSGCSERRIPVTRAWRRPRRIALDCG